MLNWYYQSGKESDVVFSTRVVFVRNLAEFPFQSKLENKEYTEILNKVSESKIISEYGLKFFLLKDLDELTRISLVEKHILSSNFIKSNLENKAMLINDDENICIMVNGKEHLKIQVFSSGLELESALNLAMELEEKLDKELKFAYSKKYGYLTSSPANVGTGLKASVIIHLPGLTKIQNITKILEVVSGLGMNIRGIYGESIRNTGNIYQISNKQTLGISEKDIIKNLKAVIEKIVEQERLARKILAKNQINLEDRLYRSYAILRNARKISTEEMKNLISDVRLGVDMGIIKEITDLQVNKINVLSKAANLQKYFGENMDEFDRSIKRCELIQKILKE